ncbi:MAG: hypothetical protein J5I93_25735 [Pirellulaceae bacterium]|nr:hypothetical protein [Pirellulaceae bacterium]
MRVRVEQRGCLLDGSGRDELENRLHFALARFASRVERVSVKVTQTPGVRGQLETTCRIVVKLRRAAEVRIAQQDADPRVCVARAAERAGRAVQRAIDLHAYNTRLNRGANQPSTAPPQLTTEN